MSQPNPFSERRLLLVLPHRCQSARCPHEKTRRFQRVHEERMMGLEPTTFCMASRRSSQLSYIRAGREL